MPAYSSCIYTAQYDSQHRVGAQEALSDGTHCSNTSSTWHGEKGLCFAVSADNLKPLILRCTYTMHCIFRCWVQGEIFRKPTLYHPPNSNQLIVNNVNISWKMSYKFQSSELSNLVRLTAYLSSFPKTLLKCKRKRRYKNIKQQSTTSM